MGTNWHLPASCSCVIPTSYTRSVEETTVAALEIQDLLLKRSTRDLIVEVYTGEAFYRVLHHPGASSAKLAAVANNLGSSLCTSVFVQIIHCIFDILEFFLTIISLSQLYPIPSANPSGRRGAAKLQLACTAHRLARI